MTLYDLTISQQITTDFQRSTVSWKNNPGRFRDQAANGPDFLFPVYFLLLSTLILICMRCTQFYRLMSKIVSANFSCSFRPLFSVQGRFAITCNCIECFGHYFSPTAAAYPLLNVYPLSTPAKESSCSCNMIFLLKTPSNLKKS